MLCPDQASPGLQEVSHFSKPSPSPDLVLFNCWDRTPWPRQLNKEGFTWGLQVQRASDHDKDGMEQTTDMAAGTAAESSLLKLQTGSRESELEMAQVFKLSRPAPNDILLPARSHLLSLHRWVYPLGTEY